MIDRTVFDLRIAAHRDMASRTNRRGWMGEAGTMRRATRVALAATLLTLARRLDPAVARGQGAAATA